MGLHVPIGATMSSAGSIWRPGKLWSLWGLMDRLETNKFLDGFDFLAKFSQELERGIASNPGFKEFHWTRAKYELIRGLVDGALSQTKTAELDVATKNLETLIAFLQRGEDIGNDQIKFTKNDTISIRRLMDHAYGNMRNELSSKMVLIVPYKMAGYFEQKTPLFGDEVFAAFESANNDIAEAGKCLALDRGTACVMHLMRALESPLRALAAALDVKTKDDWGSKIKIINSALTDRAKQSGPKLPDDQFYADVAAQFEYMKRAWRNPSMHLDNEYGVTRAEEIMHAVGSFMKVLATKLKE